MNKKDFQNTSTIHLRETEREDTHFYARKQETGDRNGDKVDEPLPQELVNGDGRSMGKGFDDPHLLVVEGELGRGAARRWDGWF
jgi:hypothetical protein